MFFFLPLYSQAKQPFFHTSAKPRSFGSAGSGSSRNSKRSSASLHHAFLEAERFAAGRVGFGGSGLAEQPAKVVEVFLVGGRFFALVPAPLSLELRRSHCRVIQPARQRMVNDSKREAR